MTDWLIGLVPVYGVWLLAGATFLSCLALPIPASVFMLTAGGFVASGDLSLAEAVVGALGGAVIGDQTGYFAGRYQGERLLTHLSKRSTVVSKAREFLARKGGGAVFLSRWFASALGPYINLAAGAARQPWTHFTFWGVAGEAVWVGLYVGLGYAFAGNIAAASDMAVNFLGFAAAGMVAFGLGSWLYSLARSGQ